MAFFDDLKHGLSDVTKTLSEKSGQFVEVQKLRLKKNNLNSELRATYLEIGKMIYEEKKAGAEFSGPVVQLCQKVELGLEAIEEVNAQIEEAKERGEIIEDDFADEDLFDEDAKDVTDTVAEQVEEAAETVVEAPAEAAEAVTEAVAEKVDEAVDAVENAVSEETPAE